MPYGMGIDIGYSGLKLKMGELGGSFLEATTLVRPVGAAPVAHCIDAGNDLDDDRMPVQIDGEEWFACIDPSSIMKDQRELNYDYAQTNQYRAVFLAALMMAERDVIDVLVTGLPVSQAKDPAVVSALTQQMEGEHKVSNKRTVTVKKVVVRPQPSAAFVRMVYEHADNSSMAKMIKVGQTVVVDPGFFSVDWVTLKNGGLIRESSGTSIRAMYRVIDQAAQMLRAEYGAGANVKKSIESALRKGESEILANGTFVEFKPFLEKAAAEVSRLALSDMKTDMALQDNVADILVLTGGGADLYKEAAKEIFPGCKHIVTFENPVTAIAEGYWLTAQGYAAKNLQAA
ncbi:ParM/StbA family protein [Hydrocarboniclastica marina]|uniref:Plasmid stability protein StbA n=1 Tax=Hydrocarboniclastica marina TaxID=2259620 RepID=A0A4P7XLT6_9ALTE|nr:ParM/StbA family protein [Hydrocarboniclastica marina]QCF28088.1 plasmid stability protein StbA [Hydrocarboniclastica marina]